MIFFLAALCLAAPLLILFVDPTHDYLPVTQSMRDLAVLPRLAATATFTGGALLWGAALLASERWPAGRWPATLWGPVVAFVVVNFLALLFAVDWRASLMGETFRYQGLAATLLYVLLFAVTAVAVRTTRDLRWLLLAVFAGALGAAGYALVQKAGLDWIPWSGNSVERPFGTMGQANVLGAFLVAAISSVLFLVLTARERWQQAVLGAGVVAMLAALFFTVSRSAYLAAGVVLLLWGAVALRWYLPALPERRQRIALRFGVVAVAAAPLVLALVAVFFTGLPQGRVAVASAENSEAVQGRLSLWRLGLEMTADRPLLGYGQDGFSIKFPVYRDQPDLAGLGARSLDPESSHNFFIDLLSGTGVLGLLAFLGLVGAVFWHAGRRALATDDSHLRLAFVALGGGVLGYLVAIFFGFMEATSGWLFWLLLGAMAGLLAQTASEPGEESREEQGGERRRRSRQEKRRDREKRREERLMREAAAQPNVMVSGLAAIVLFLLGVVALGWAATITAADLAAGQAQLATGRGEREAAERLAGRAATWNPLRKEYLFQKAEAHERALALERAIETYEKLIRRHEPAAVDLLNLARARMRLAQTEGRPVEEDLPEIERELERALALDPFNTPIHLEIADVFERLGNDLRAFEIGAETYCWGIICD